MNDLQRAVDNDVKRVETATNQDAVDLMRWRVRQVAAMQQARHNIDVAMLIGIPVIFILILLVIFYSGHS